jgi:hypothetical protein
VILVHPYGSCTNKGLTSSAGGIAMFSQATTHALVPTKGDHLTLQDIEPSLELGTNIHIAPTKLICLENTLSGIVFPQDEVVKIGNLARQHDIAMHLDGARIWNVAAKVIEDKGLDAESEEDRTSVWVSCGFGLHAELMRQTDRVACTVRYGVVVLVQGDRGAYRIVSGFCAGTNPSSTLLSLPY